MTEDILADRNVREHDDLVIKWSHRLIAEDLQSSLSGREILTAKNHGDVI